VEGFRTSIVIPIYNKIAIVKACISLNIGHAACPCEWIVIDNNSDQQTKDGIVELKAEAESKGHRFVVIEETQNTGVAKAWNKGVALAKGEYVCILNNDCVMMPRWDDKLIAEGAKYHLAIFTPYILEPNMFKKQYGLPEFLNSAKNWAYMAKKNSHTVRQGVFTGVILFGKKEYFTAVGPFDEAFWLSLEEYDYLLRARDLGLKTGTVGAITAFHLGGITRNEMKTDGGTFNQTYFQKKWGWNFELAEAQFLNAKIRSVQKFMFKHFFLMSRLNMIFPKRSQF